MLLSLWDKDGFNAVHVEGEFNVAMRQGEYVQWPSHVFALNEQDKNMFVWIEGYCAQRVERGQHGLVRVSMARFHP